MKIIKHGLVTSVQHIGSPFNVAVTDSGLVTVWSNTGSRLKSRDTEYGRAFFLFRAGKKESDLVLEEEMVRCIDEEFKPNTVEIKSSKGKTRANERSVLYLSPEGAIEILTLSEANKIAKRVINNVNIGDSIKISNGGTMTVLAADTY